MKVREFLVILEQDEDGTYIASVPDLPGCHTQGDTIEEVKDNIKEAIELYLEVKPEMIDDEPANFIGVEKVKVEV
jgi:predicted RNase H-like HicB family nuclease